MLERAEALRTSENNQRLRQVKDEGQGVFPSPFDEACRDWLRKANLRRLGLAETFDRVDER